MSNGSIFFPDFFAGTALSKLLSQATRSRASRGLRRADIGGIAEMGGVISLMSARFTREIFSPISISTCSGVSESKIPPVVFPLLRVIETTPKPEATVAPGTINDSIK